MKPCRVVNTRTPWGRDAYDLCVFQAVAAKPSVNLADLEAEVGGTNLQVRMSVRRLIARSAVAKLRRGRFHALAPQESAIARRVALWERPGGLLLREVYTPWRSSLPPRQTGLVNGFIDRKLRVLVELVERHIMGPLVTTTAEGKSRMDRRVLRALTIRPGATVRDLHPLTGGQHIQARESLHRLVATSRRAVWRAGGYWIPDKTDELGYVGINGRRGREVLDRLVLAAVCSYPEGATHSELWIHVPGSQVQLRASVARLLHRDAIRWNMWSGVTRYFPVSEEGAP